MKRLGCKNVTVLTERNLDLLQLREFSHSEITYIKCLEVWSGPQFHWKHNNATSLRSSDNIHETALSIDPAQQGDLHITKSSPGHDTEPTYGTLR